MSLDSRNWHLRTQDGMVYGPVPTKTLRLWAEQGRIQPGNEISEDRKRWIPAHELVELDLTWFLEDQDGLLMGPFNKRAAERLITDGRVTDKTKLIPISEADLSKVVNPEARVTKRAPDGNMEFNLTENAPLGASNEEKLRLECENLRLRVSELENTNKNLIASAEKGAKNSEKLLDAERKKVSNLCAEIEEIRLESFKLKNKQSSATISCDDGDLSKLSKELDDTKSLLNSVKSERDELAKKLASLEATLAEKANLETRAQEVDGELASTKNQLAESESVRDELAKKLASLEAMLAEKADLETRAQEVDGELASTKNQLAESESVRDELAKKLASLEATLAENHQQESITTTQEEELSALKNRLAEAEAVRDELTLKLTEYDAVKIENLRLEESAKNAATIAANEVESANKKLTDIERKNAELASQIAELEASSYSTKQALEERIDSLLDTVNQHTQTIAEKDAEISALKSSISIQIPSSCEEQTAEIERLNDEIKNLKEMANLAALAAEAEANARETEITRLRDENKKLASSPKSSATDNQTFERLFAAEMEFLSQIYTTSQNLNKTIEQKIDGLQRVHSEEKINSMERESNMRNDRFVMQNLREEIDALRAENMHIQNAADSREHELRNRMRMLEAELDNTKTMAMETSSLKERVKQLQDLLSERDKQLVGEVRNAEISRSMIQESAPAPDDSPSLSAPQEERPPKSVRPKHKSILDAAPWFKFKE